MLSALDLFEQLGDRHGEARVHENLAWIAGAQSRPSDALEHSVPSGTRGALIFAIVMITCGAIVSFLIPRTSYHEQPATGVLESLEPLEPMDPDPALVDHHVAPPVVIH